MKTGIQIKMGLNILINDIEEYMDAYLWDDLRMDIKTILWKSGEYSWTDLESSDEEDSEWLDEDENQQRRIDELIDQYEERNEIIDFSDIISSI